MASRVVLRSSVNHPQPSGQREEYMRGEGRSFPCLCLHPRGITHTLSCVCEAMKCDVQEIGGRWDHVKWERERIQLVSLNMEQNVDLRQIIVWLAACRWGGNLQGEVDNTWRKISVSIAISVASLRQSPELWLIVLEPQYNANWQLALRKRQIDVKDRYY